MKARLSTIFIFLCTTIVLSAQMQNPVKWDFSTEKKGNTLRAFFHAQIDDGWHVYDQDLPESGPRSTTIVYEELYNAKTAGKILNYPTPTEKYEAMFDMNLRWYEKNVTFSQYLELADEKDYAIKGYVEYMACDETSCLPPTKEYFTFENHSKMPATGKDVKTNKTATTPFQFESIVTESEADSINNQETEVEEHTKGIDAWQPVIQELNAYGDTEETTNSNLLWSIFCIGLLGGLLAVVTPCVWPIIPMTVSFFLHKKDGRGKRSALLYGLSILLIYVGFGMLITLIFGADALNALATNAVFNIILFLVLLFFAISFFGGFDLTLPASWSTKTETQADKTSGILSILLMAFTLVIVSFSCTGPIIGTLLVHISTQGNLLAPIVGMLGFALALAGPFTLFALFPSVMKKLPRSGSWLNTVKVLLGFFELAFSLKFLSVADLAYGWHILDREVFIVLWIVIAVFAGLYIIGKIQFKADGQIEKISVMRLFGGIAAFAFALYLLPGLWGAPLKAVSAFAPPMWTQDFNLYDEAHATFNDYDKAIAYARKNNKPLLLDFSGYGCVNCRKMEASVWNDPQVKTLIQEKYVLVSLFVDDRTELSQPIQVQENGKHLTLKTLGEKWSYLQRHKFGSMAQPFYVELNSNGEPLNHSYAYSEDIPAFVKFLQTGLKNFN